MKRKGFTLIELLAVIVILAIIALIAVPVILGIINDTKIKKYKIEEGYIKDAAKLYYASKNIDDYTTVNLQTLVDNKFIDPVRDLGNGKTCEGKAIEVEDGKLKGCLKCSNYTTKGCGYDEPTECSIINDKYYGKNKEEITEEEYYMQCPHDSGTSALDDKCIVKDGKYYDNNGKVVTETIYNNVCKNEPCGKKDGIYYDNEGQIVDKEDFILSCRTNITANPCSKVLGKFYDNNGNEVSENDYNKSCDVTDDPIPSPDNDIIDPNPGVICGNATNDYEGFLECHIKSVEDLVTFTKLVNIDGYDFLNHTVYLDKDLNITETSGKSYVNQTKNAEFDVNNDGSISSIKTEMTTGKGFLPVGSESHQFKGKFDGQANTIENLMINRPGVDNVGLFGYIGEEGSIVGLNIKNIVVTGNNNTGGISGQSRGIINEVTISGNVTGNDNVGSAAGLQPTGLIRSIISNTNITGNESIYGLSNQGYGVVESGTITGNSKVFKSSSSPALVNSNVKLGNVSVTGSGFDLLYEDSQYGNLNIYSDDMYSELLDTYLGGDNDSSGYYFDYDSKGKVVLKSTKRNPIDTSLKGNGTEGNPYLIYTPKDMKKIAAMPTESNYYKLMNNINFYNAKYYMIGTYRNQFNGTFEGNANSIINANVAGYSYAGLFGNGGVILGVNAKNVNVTGNDNVSGFGQVSKITDSTINGNIISNNIAGAACPFCTARSVIMNVNISANTIDGIGTIGVVTGGSVNTSNKGYIINEGYVNEKLKNIENINTNSMVNIYKDSEYGNLNTFTTEQYADVLDTWLAGDNDGNGYYFDYDSKGNVVLKSTAKNPINLELKTFKKESNANGGSKENPYLIYDEKDMKKIAAMPKEENYYILMNDIDYKNKKYYMIGTSHSSDVFRGHLDGGAHTLKNISLYGPNYHTGMFAGGSVVGLNIENINIIGENNVGSILTYNGTLSSISITGNVKNINLNNNSSLVTGICDNCNLEQIISNINVDGANAQTSAGSSSIYYGIIEGGSVKGNSSNSQISSGNFINRVNANVTLNGVKYTGENSFPVNKYNDLKYYAQFKLGDVYLIDTPYTGDTNGDGYWFEYNSDKSDIIVTPYDESKLIIPDPKKICKVINNVYYDIYGYEVNKEEHMESCKHIYQCNIINGKYYDKDANEVDEETHIKSCASQYQCKSVNGKYYDKDANEVDEETHIKSCASKYQCKLVNGNYYDKDANKVDKVGYEKSCTTKYQCNIINGKYYDENSNEVSKSSYENSCGQKYKCTKTNGRYYDINGKIVDKSAYEESCLEPKPNPDIVFEIKEDPSKSMPECSLNYYNVAGEGFNASYTCKDSIGIAERRHIYWVRSNVDDFNSLINWQPLTGISNETTIYSVWTINSATAQGIDIPYKGSCYYFYYGARNTAGNYRMYRSKVCNSY